MKILDLKISFRNGFLADWNDSYDCACLLDPIFVFNFIVALGKTYTMLTNLFALLFVPPYLVKHAIYIYIYKLRPNIFWGSVEVAHRSSAAYY